MNKLVISPEQYVSPFEIAVKEHVPTAGDIYLDKSPSCNGAVIIRLDSRIEDRPGCWNVTLLEGNHSDKTINEDTLKEYYQPLLGNYEETMTKAREIADGDLRAIESLMANTAPSAASEELMATESPEHIRAILDSSENLKNRLEEIHLAADIIIENRKSELDARLRQMNGYLQEMKEKVQNIVKVITILNLYTGATVDLHQITKGATAGPDVRLTLRQRILYMDEELCVHLDHEADYTDVPAFFEWLSQKGNRDIIVPEEKCIVALKPKRFSMSYRSGDPVYDYARNMWNKHTYIVIRNGDNLWWAESDDLELWDCAFPHSDYQDEAMKHLGKDTYEAKRSRLEMENINYRTTKYMMFIQGLVDQQPQLFGAQKGRVNLMKLSGVTLVRDDEDLIGTGIKPWAEFKKEKNALIRRGTRILYIAGHKFRDGANSRAWNSGGEPMGYYVSEYSEPQPPATGIYHADTYERVISYKDGKPVRGTMDRLIFRYNPKDTVYDRSGYDFEGHERKRSVAWKYESSHVLNYDDISVEELRSYLEDRTQRKVFADMMPLLKGMLLHKTEERKDEEAFKSLIRETIRKERSVIITQEKMDEAIAWWKEKVIYTRPLRSDDAKAFRMIKQYIMKEC